MERPVERRVGDSGRTGGPLRVQSTGGAQSAQVLRVRKRMERGAIDLERTAVGFGEPRAGRARLGDGAAMRENEMCAGLVRRLEQGRTHKTVASLELTDHSIAPADRGVASAVDVEGERRESLLPRLRGIRACAVDLADDAAAALLSDDDRGRRSPALD